MATTSAHLSSTSAKLQFEDEVLVVGISGGSCSGKSSVASYLLGKLPHTINIHQDDFYMDIAHIQQSQEGNYLWDVPESLNISKLVDFVKEAVRRPRDFCKVCATTGEQRRDERHAPCLSSPSSPSTSTSTSTSSCTDPLTTQRHLIIIEGTMILNISELRPLLQAAFFIKIDYDTSRERRRCRDYGALVDPPGYFDNHVWPGYLRDKKLAESLTNPTVYMLDGGEPLERLQREVENEVTKLLCC